MNRNELLEAMLANSQEALAASVRLLSYADGEAETMVRLISEVSDDLACRLRRRAHEATRSLFEAH